MRAGGETVGPADLMRPPPLSPFSSFGGKLLPEALPQVGIIRRLEAFRCVQQHRRREALDTSGKRGGVVEQRPSTAKDVQQWRSSGAIGRSGWRRPSPADDNAVIIDTGESDDHLHVEVLRQVRRLVLPAHAGDHRDPFLRLAGAMEAREEGVPGHAIFGFVAEGDRSDACCEPPVRVAAPDLVRVGLGRVGVAIPGCLANDCAHAETARELAV